MSDTKFRAIIQDLFDEFSAGIGVGQDGGPYTVQADTPAVGTYRVTDTTSGNFFDIPTGVVAAIGDADADTGITTTEGGGSNGGDLMEFTVDGVTVGSVDILAGGITKWTLDGILDPICYAGAPVTTVTRDALPGITAGYLVYNSDNSQYEYYDGSAWQPVASVVDEVVENAGALAGAAPADAKLGVDTTSGQLYYVVAGNWTAVPVASVDLNTTVSDETGANGTGNTTPSTAPAGTPDVGDTHIEIYDDVKIYFTAVAANWTAPTVVEVARDLTSFADATTASDDATGDGGTASTAARSDHKHAAQGVSADANQLLNDGTDGLAHLAAGTLDSDSGLALLSNDMGQVSQDALKVVVLAAAPVDGTTVAYFTGQWFWDNVNKTLYEATAKSTDPDVSGAGSTFVEIKVLDNLVTADLISTADRTHTFDNNLVVGGTGTKAIRDDDTGGNQSDIVVDVTRAFLFASNGTEDSLVAANRNGSLALNSTTGVYDITTAPITNSDVTGQILMRETASGELREADPTAFQALSGAADPVNGTTVAWYVNQPYFNTTTGNLFYATTKSTDPDSSGTGSAWAAATVSETKDKLVPTGTNTLPALSQLPKVDSQVKFFINGQLDYEDQISAAGTTVTVAGTFNATYGFNIETTDVVTAIYF